MLGRIIFLGLLILVVLTVVRTQVSRRSSRSVAPRANPARSETIEKMVICAQCGTHFPQSEAHELLHQGKPIIFCSAEHRTHYLAAVAEKP